MTTTQSTRPFGYTVSIEGEQADSGSATLPDWFDGDLSRLGAWIAWRWLTNCKVPADAACPIVTAAVTVNGQTVVYSV